MPEQPVSKLNRLWISGETAAKVSGRVLGYYVKRPFMNIEDRRRARDQVAEESARTVFKGLSLLKGTALKMAQQLSLEMDMLPEAVCRELARTYHEAPPINRALVRRVVQSAFGRPPEKLFAHFDPNAFAAASLGQVHAAQDDAGAQLAVKIQYPGIAGTIDSDMGLLRQMLRPIIQNDQLRPVLEEIAARLHEEVDYLQEADNLNYFAGHLHIEGVRIPRVRPEMTAATVLTTTRMPGRPLDIWLKSHPDQAAVDQVAQTLQQLFITGLYDLHAIHADPNPGNFIISDDLTVGLVDFGCIKRLDPVFVKHYQRLCRASAHRHEGVHITEMISLGLIPSPMKMDNAVKKTIQGACNTISNWFGRLYQHEHFDFMACPDFIAEGKAVMNRFHDLRRHVNLNPEFIFLDRTRYGLLRLFEQMGARVRFRNTFEWGDGK
jgi:predicted unusual protein kinase regulating ubiquinone biosynthesis (AarF/ABC1/UbiB family)